MNAPNEAGRHCSSHNNRSGYLKNHHQSIYKHFRSLLNVSTIARYLHDNDSDKAYKTFQDYITPAEVTDKIVKRRLRPVEQYAVSRLSDGARGLLKRVT